VAMAFYRIWVKLGLLDRRNNKWYRGTGASINNSKIIETTFLIQRFLHSQVQRS